MRWRIGLGVAMTLMAVTVAFLVNPQWWATLQQAFSVESINAMAVYLRGFGLWTPLVSFALMVLQAVIAPLPFPLIAGANGILYGIWWGTLLSWTGGLAGAAVSFGLARWLGRGAVARWVAPQYLAQVDRLSEAHGFWIIVAARLIPLISLDFIGYLAGLSKIR